MFLPVLFSMLFGAFSGTMIQKQTTYCECKRSDFKGAYCESLKPSTPKGDTCHE